MQVNEMKMIKVNEKWCLGCHLCEYYCAFANSGVEDMVKALKDMMIQPKLRIEQKDKISFAVSCRHCEDPICVKSCITGALSIIDNVVSIDKKRCIGCYTCVLVCPYGAVMPSQEGAVRKCELCVGNSVSSPACVSACPNKAIELVEV